MKTYFVINPCSGRNRRRPWLAAAIREFARAQRREATIAITEGAGHATELARAAALSGHERVVAVGGDGTMNEVAQALIRSPATLGLVPCGSGNGLARHLGLPRSLRGALELILGADGKTAAIDSGVVDGRPFFNVMGLGFDAEVSRRFNGLTRRGLPAYVRATLGLLRRAQPERCTIVAGDRRISLDAFLVTVANSDQYGNNARIAPGAHVDDGLLDLVAIKGSSLLALATLAPRLFLGTIDRSSKVVRLRGPAFTLERPAPGVIHTDGETHAAGRSISVRVNPHSLHVWVPASASIATAPAGPAPAWFALQLP